ncbi:MAG: hypothetical protein R2883_07195 [Caldisericia bacterium]
MHEFRKFTKESHRIGTRIITSIIIYLPVIGNVSANEEHKNRLSDFGVKLVGNECAIGSFVGPTWLANEGNRVYIVDSINTRVQAILKDGTPQYAYGLLGSHEFLTQTQAESLVFRTRFTGLIDSRKILVRGNRSDDEIEKELHAINPQTGESFMVHPSDIFAFNGLLYIANTAQKISLQSTFKRQSRTHNPNKMVKTIL